jgi:hypothetical protein
MVNLKPRTRGEPRHWRPTELFNTAAASGTRRPYLKQSHPYLAPLTDDELDDDEDDVFEDLT